MNQAKQSTAVRVAVLAVVIFGISGWAYWRYVMSTPTRVFDRMLGTMLSTSSVTKQTSQEEGGQKLTQTVQLSMQPKGQVHSINVLDQGTGTVVTTESIAGEGTDFVRYNSIKTEQKSATGKDFDFSKVVGTWGKLADNEADGSQAQLFNQTILGVVPVANLPRAERQKLLALIDEQNVFAADYGKVKREIVAGRPTYTYPVTVDPVAYITMLKAFSKSLGMDQLDDLDASQYAGTPALKFEFGVDVWSTQLTKVTYVDSTRTETYSAYGARVVVPEPHETIGLDELQGRLQQIQ